jgi:hypothetical protein
MKFNPYAVLLATGALMLATVLLAQVGMNPSLLRDGAASVDEDVASFARTVSNSGAQSSGGGAARGSQDSARTRLAAVDRANSR